MADAQVVEPFLTEREASAFARGFERRWLRGQREILIRWRHRRIGALPANAIAQVEALSMPQWSALADAFLDFADSGHFDSWIAQLGVDHPHPSANVGVH